MKSKHDRKKEQEQKKGKRGAGKVENREEYRNQAAHRAATKIRRLIIANDLRYHWTLTYGEKAVTERNEAFQDFKKFIMRLSYRAGKKIPYVAVVEVQKGREEKTGDAVLHFHMAIPYYLEYSVVDEAWGNGFVWVEDKTSGELTKVAAYLCKYLKKDQQEREQEKKRYLRSQGLKEPVKIRLLVDEQHYEEIKKRAGYFHEFEQEGGYVEAWLIGEYQEDIQDKGDIHNAGCASVKGG